MYHIPVDTVENLITRIGLLVARELIEQILSVIERVYHIMIRRYNVCNELDGRHVEPPLSCISTNRNGSTVDKTVWLI